MFAFKVVKPLTKGMSKSTKTQASHATSQLTQRASKLDSNSAGGNNKSTAAQAASRRLSWSFDKIPVHPPDRTAQRDSQAGQPATTTRAAPDILSQVLRSPGQRLDATMASVFESNFRQTLPDVRVHSGPQAEESARAINARAWSFGRDIVFGKDAYAPQTETGRGLLMHELIHVTQQPRIDGAPRGVAGREAPAERLARAGIAGGSGVAHPGLVHRQEATPVAAPAPAPAQTAPAKEAAPASGASQPAQAPANAPAAKEDTAAAEKDPKAAIRKEVRDWLDRENFGVPLVLDSGRKAPEEWHAVYSEQRWTLAKITDDTFDVLAQSHKVYGKPELKRGDVWEQVYQYYQEKEAGLDAESWQFVIQGLYTPSYSLASTSPIGGSRVQNPFQLTLGGTLAEHKQGAPGVEHQFAVTGSFFNLGSGHVDWFQNALAQYQLSLVSPIGRDFQLGGAWASAQSSIYAQLGAGLGANWVTPPGAERKAYLGFLLQPGVGGQVAVSIGWFQLIVNGTVVFSVASPTKEKGSAWTGTLGVQGGVGIGGQF